MSAVTADQVLKASAATGNSPRWLLRSQNRDEWIVKDRVAVALVMRSLGMSWPAIGRELNRSHTTVMRACESMGDDKDVKKVFSSLCKTLGLKPELCTAKEASA